MNHNPRGTTDKNTRQSIAEEKKKKSSFHDDRQFNHDQSSRKAKDNISEIDELESSQNSGKMKGTHIGSGSQSTLKQNDQSKRAYEYYKGNSKKQEQLFLDQHDRNMKLKEHQNRLNSQLIVMQDKLKRVDDDIQQHSNRERNYGESEIILRENIQLKKELEAFKKGQLSSRSSEKSQAGQSQAGQDPRDKKKIQDLLRLVENLKNQLKESEEQMKRYQQYVKQQYQPELSMVGVGNKQQGHSGSDSGTGSNMKEYNLKMIALEAKNTELLENFQLLKKQHKVSRQESAQLIVELKEAKENLNLLSKENRSLELSMQSAEEYEKQIDDLKRQRDQTENRLKELISSPFLQETGDKSQKLKRMEQLQEDVIRLQAVNESLNTQNRSQQKELSKLSDTLNDSKKFIEDLKEENEALKVDLTTQATKLGPLQQLQQLDHETFIKTLGALTLKTHKNRIKGIQTILNEENPDEVQIEDEEEQLELRIRSLEQDNEQLAIEKGNIALQLEKVQALLKIQTETNLQREKIYKIEKEAADLRYKALLDKTQELAEFTDMKGLINGELQFEENDQSKGKLVKKGNIVYTDNVSEFSDDEQDNQDERYNYFDLWVGQCTIYPMNLPKVTGGQINQSDHILLFSTVDFYDHDTQTTQVVEGISSNFNFQCSYRVTTKDDFLNYLETGFLKIELYAASQQDAIQLGSIDIRLGSFITDNKQENISAVLNQRVSLKQHGFSIGEINIKARLRRPIANQLIFYMEKKQLIEQRNAERKEKQKRMNESNMIFDEFEKKVNDSIKRKLVIAIEKGQEFMIKSSTFVYYSIQGRDYYTRSVPGTNPYYDHHQIIEIDHLSTFANQIAQNPLKFFIFDDLQPFETDLSMDQDCLGVASIRLNDLNKNQIIDSIMEVENDQKERVGYLHVKAFWYEYTESREEIQHIVEGGLAKQWEKEFIIKLAKAIKERKLNQNSAFLVFDRNNDLIIDIDEFVSTCLGTLNMTNTTREEIIYFYEKQRQPFNRDVFEMVVGQYLIADKQKILYLEEMNILEKNRNKRVDLIQQTAQNFIIEQKKEQQMLKMQQQSLMTQGGDPQSSPNSIKQVNEMLSQNTTLLLNNQQFNSIKEKVAEAIFSQMQLRSALEVFTSLDSDKDDEINPTELQQYLMQIGVGVSQEELYSFIQTSGIIKQGAIGLMDFVNKLSKEPNMTRLGYQERYPKLKPQQEIGQGDTFTDEQIINQIEEKIFEFMIVKKVKILKLHELMDKDKSQSVGRPEFRAFFKNKIGVELTRRDLDVVFQIFDKDNDGSISVKEFVDHLKEAINIRSSLKELRPPNQRNISPLQSRGILKQEEQPISMNSSLNHRSAKSLKFLD